MNFLLDTNVVSEPMRPRPNAGVLKWLGEVDEESTFISVVTITELRYGIERLATGTRLDGWLQRDLRACALREEYYRSTSRWPTRVGGSSLEVNL